ncbi:MAG: hypothetical protein HOV87_19450 [Catenulispora sp.]|nr:hypothetical protein [Catenulispora sp.]
MVAIEHVIVLMLENRSFDHMLGFLDHPDPHFDGLRAGGPHTNPGWDGAAPVAATPGAKPVLPSSPDHSHDAVMEQLGFQGKGAARRATNQGFVASYERLGRGLAPAAFGGLLGPVINWWLRRKAKNVTPIMGRGPLVILSQPPEQVPVLSKLALEFAVCTRWFSSVPGETWPNRNFAHAATSDGTTEIQARFYTDRTIFELLEEQGVGWHVYHDDTPQLWAFPRLWDTPDRHANWFHLSDFAAHAAAGTLPAYSFIEPNHRPPLHTLDHEPIVGAPDVSNSQHPGNNVVDDAAYDAFEPTDAADFARGEALIADIYEALRAHRDLFERSLLLITYDEHGGFYDHVPPPTDVPDPGDPRGVLARLLNLLYRRKAATFDFTALGARVPAVVVSPYIPAATVCTDTHDHASIPATLRALFAPGAEPLTRRDAWATPFHRVLTLAEPRRTCLPDLLEYTTSDTVSAPKMAAMPAPAPPYAKDFTDQADRVWQHLRHVGEPETAEPIAEHGVARAAGISEVFLRAAQRHRAVRVDEEGSV